MDKLRINSSTYYLSYLWKNIHIKIVASQETIFKHAGNIWLPPLPGSNMLDQYLDMVTMKHLC